MRRVIPAIILVVVLAVGAGLIATTAYQAGLSAAVTTAAGSGTVVAPVVVPGYGYGYGWSPFGFGFGFFGFLGTLLFLFIVFGLLRAILFRGGPGRHGGWGRGGQGGWGRGGWGDHGPWESRAHETFDAWHQRAHDPSDPGPSAGGPATPSSGSGPVTPGNPA
jgi:hypothetical protein